MEYEAFGLRIASDLPLPELRERRGGGTGEADVAVRLGEPPQRWAGAVERLRTDAAGWVAEPNALLLRVPGAATFCVANGDSVTVSPARGAEADKVRLYLLGTCMAALLMQRDVLPLHGSAVRIGDEAYVFVGRTGAGKSTLARTFMREGYAMLSDDVVPIVTGPGGRPYVVPSYPQQKLWSESLSRLDMNAADYRPIFERETKYAVPAAERFCDEPLPLGGWIELSRGEVGEEAGPEDGAGTRAENRVGRRAERRIGARPLEGLERIRALHRHTFRNALLAPLGKVEWHFRETARLAGTTRAHELRRPAEGFSASALKDEILNMIRRGDFHGASDVVSV